GPGQRIAALIEHRDTASADQKIPFAPDAVVNSGSSMKKRAVVQRPDSKFMPKASVVLPRIGAISPKVHERMSTASFGPDGKARNQKQNKFPATASPRHRAAK